MKSNYSGIYRECIKVSFATAATYRFNFVLNAIIMLVSNVLFPMVTILIYGSGAGFPGWSFYEVLLIQAVFTLSAGISGALFNGILWVTMRHIIEGSLEIVLIKPVDCLFYLMASTFEPDSIGLIAGGCIMFAIAAANAGAISLLMWLQFFALFLAGLLVMMGISFIMAATSFKWVGNSRIPEIFESIKSFGKYPQSILNKSVAAFAAFVIPVAMVGCFPAAALLGKASMLMFAAVIPCVLFALSGIFLYKHMIRLYEGVGG